MVPSPEPRRCLPPRPRPLGRFIEGIYVLYTYAALPHTSQRVQKNLSTPEAGSELNILRHMTFRI